MKISVISKLKILKRKISNQSGKSVVGFFTVDALARQIYEFGWSIGKYSYGAPTVIGEALGRLTIGNYCSLGPGFTVVLANHNGSHTSTYPFLNIPEFANSRKYEKDLHADATGDVIIGHDVWIGQNVTIMPNVRVGNGVIIGAESVVYSDIPDYVSIL